MPPAALLLALLALAASPRIGPGSQDPSAAPLELGEGPLDNDVFLPVAREAEQALARGDQAWARALAGDGAPQDPGARAWIEVLEPWHDALAAGGAADSVSPRPWLGGPDLDSPWPDPDGTAGGGAGDRRVRRTESLADAVLRRLLALPPGGREAWNARFASLAEQDLASAGRVPDRLAEVERLHPGTPGAARAALARAEQELEAGRDPFARTWLERAARHAELAGDAALATAIERRLVVLADLRAPAPDEPEAWRRATSLELVAEIPLEDLTQRRFVYRPRPGVRVQPDVAWLDDPDGDLVALQTEERLVVLDLGGGRRVADFAPLELAAAVGQPLSPRDPPTEAPGWPARPATDGERLVLVLRSEPSALVCLRLGAPDLFGGLRVPVLEWVVAGGRRLVAPGRQPADLEGWPDGTIQPGPLVHAGSVLVQVHQADDESGTRWRAHLVALDLADGRVRWSRLLARGAPLALTSLRFLDAGGGEAVGQPLALVDGRVLVGTHLGAAALVEACDGRPAWSFAYRRRPGHGDRWSGAAPVPFGPPPGALLAPADSDRAYWLRGRADLAGQGLVLHPPLRIDEAEVLVGGGARRAVVLTRSGRERALGEWDGADGSRREAPWLGPGEVFTGQGAVSDERVLFATDRALYLHDRQRELYLLDHASYPRPFPAAGGRVVAHRDRVLVVGPHLAWLFVAR